jgi:hypothetical protein
MPANEMPSPAYVAARQYEGDGQRPSHDEACDDQELEHVLYEAHGQILRG